MVSLIKFKESERRRTGRIPNTKQLRTALKSRIHIFPNELDDLYSKTFQYEEMQKAIEDQKGRLMND